MMARLAMGLQQQARVMQHMYRYGWKENGLECADASAMGERQLSWEW